MGALAVTLGLVLCGCPASHFRDADAGVVGDAGRFACDPGASRCTSWVDRETCSAEGMWVEAEPCVNECVDGECLAVPPSCRGLPETCGPLGDAFCCRSPRVQGGTYDRVNDDPDYPATVSDFRLDQYQVTVGRFRKFVQAAVDGWRPEVGAGKHTHLNGGEGLASSEGFEGGWEAAWNDALFDDEVGWNEALTTKCRSALVEDAWTWTKVPGNRETHPITCESWYAAFAFCIWDGGFLPSDAEWGYAAEGGDAQREYPWGDEAPGRNTERAIYGCLYPDDEADDCVGVQNIAPVGSAPAGNGRYGHADLAGNTFEWAFDTASELEDPCVDCAQLAEDVGRLLRGSAFYSSAQVLTSDYRSALVPRLGYDYVGFRCARPP